VLKKVIDLKRDIAVLDVGTNTTCATIAKSGEKNLETSSLDVKNKIRVVGVGYQLAQGIKRGVITSLEKLEDSILNAIATAEKEAQKAIKSILIALPSWAIRSHAVENSIDIGQLSVDDIHVNSLLNFDTARYTASSQEIIHVFPISYSIDGIDGIQDPIGMVGNKLFVSFHVITVQSLLIQNIKNCLNKNNIEVEGFISSTYASGLSVLLPDEIASGVILIDIGGSTTTIAGYYESKLLHIGTIPIGGHNITKDTSTILRTTNSNAERLKILYGIASVSPQNDEEQILVPRIDEYGEEHIQNISRSMLDTIISARLEEIFELVQKHITESGADRLLCQRIVITGGGSRIAGISDLVKTKRFFGNSSVRLGKPIGVIGSHDFVQTASFASSAGSILYCMNELLNNRFLPSSEKSIWQKVITWIKRGV
jgi:cell division protein FtsA